MARLPSRWRCSCFWASMKSVVRASCCRSMLFKATVLGLYAVIAGDTNEQTRFTGCTIIITFNVLYSTHLIMRSYFACSYLRALCTLLYTAQHNEYMSIAGHTIDSYVLIGFTDPSPCLMITLFYEIVIICFCFS